MVACFHCGGAIKPAAKLCKHCKRTVEPHSADTSADSAGSLIKRGYDLHFAKRFDEAASVYEQIIARFPQAAEAAMARRQLQNLGRGRTEEPAVAIRADAIAGNEPQESPKVPETRPPQAFPAPLASARMFIAQRPFVSMQAFDDVLAVRQSDDAAAVFRQLAAIGQITQVQAEALVAEFHQAQMLSARAVIMAASAQGLIPASHVEQALASYAPLASKVAIQDHLVGAGLLTRAQADALSTQRAEDAHRAHAANSKRLRRIAFSAALVLALIVIVAVVAGGNRSSDDDDVGVETMAPQTFAAADPAPEQPSAPATTPRFDFNTASPEEVVDYCERQDDGMSCDDAVACGLIAAGATRAAGCFQADGTVSDEPRCSEYSLTMGSRFIGIARSCHLSMHDAIERLVTQ